MKEMNKVLGKTNEKRMSTLIPMSDWELDAVSGGKGESEWVEGKSNTVGVPELMLAMKWLFAEEQKQESIV